MTATRTPREVFDRLVTGVCALANGDTTQVEALAALYAEHTDVTHPMAPLGDTALRTRDELRRHFAALPDRAAGLTAVRAAGVHVHDTADPEVIVAEFHYEGTGAAGPFALPGIFVLRVRDGLIVSSRDYVHHLGIARAAGRLDDLVAALTAA